MNRLNSDENSQYLQTILESTADGILIVDRKGKVTHFNSKFVKMWRIQPELLETKDDIKLLEFVVRQLNEPSAFMEKVRSLYETGDVSFDTIRFNDGRVFERYSSPVVEEGEVNGRVWSFRDVTRRKKNEMELEKHRRHLEELVAERTDELKKVNRDLRLEIDGRQRTEDNLRFEMTQRKQAEEQLTVLVKELERVNTELEDFAYIVSHDLKAPLRGISSLARWLVDDYSEKLNEEGRGYLDKLMVRTLRMYNLIDGILQYSGVGRASQDPRPLESMDIVNEVLDSLSLPGAVTVKINEPFPTVIYDRTLLVQLFQNLIGNAVKHMGRPDGEIVLSCRDWDEEWEFCVRDNGVGIEKRHFERIFKLFQSLNPGPGTGTTGIGLSLVKKIVERCGGSVRVESEVGKGSAFFFTIPKKLPSTSHKRGSTVLVIDDNTAFLKVAKTLLELEGYQVLTAITGEEAYRVLRFHPGHIHLALMDILIPGEDALHRFSLLRELRPGMKIIACTGTTLTETVEQLRAGGVDGVVRKPFTVEELNDILNKAV